MSTQDLPTEFDESKAAVATANKSWIAICTDLRDHDIVGLKAEAPKAADPSRRAWSPLEVWFWLLCEATHKDRQRLIQGRYIRLSRGQLVVSLRYLCGKANWGMKAVRVFLERLRRFDMITLSVENGSQMSLDFAGSHLSDVCPKRGTGVTLVTICNYDKYQKAPTARGTARAQEGHSKGTGGAQTSTRYTDTRDTHQSPQEGIDKKEDQRGELSPSGIDAATSDRLPFSADVIRQLSQFDGLDVEALVADYVEKTKGKSINDPDAYLLKMGRGIVAGRLKISVEQLKRITSRNREEKALEMANVVGAFSKPSDDVLRRARRYNAERADAALAVLTGKSFRSQAEVDRAFEGEIAVQRYSAEAKRRSA